MGNGGQNAVRQRAERALAVNERRGAHLKRAEPTNLAHELAVHQVELEIQNEELRNVRAAAEEARDHYLELYEFAPLGYFTLDNSSRIVEANLAGCRLLQTDRRAIKTKHFTTFIARDEADSFYLHCKKTLEEGVKQTLETRMQKADGTLFWAQLDSIKAGEERLRVTVSDISYCRTAQTGLAESEEKFRALAEHGPNMIFMNKNGRIVYANRKCVEVMGYGLDELYSPGFDFLCLVKAESRAAVMTNFKAHGEGRDVPPYEYSLVTRDGTPLECILASTLVHYDGGLAIMGTITDITERKRTERALIESEARYRNVVELANDGICIIQNTLIKYCNSKLADMWGGAVEEVQDTPFPNYLHPDALPLVVDRYNRRKAGEQVPPRYETALRSKEGKRVDVELSVGALDYRGQPAEIVIVRDITERRRAEDALQQSERKYRDLVESAPVGIVLASAEGNVLEVNETLVRMHGYSSKQEFVKSAVADRFVDLKDRSRWIALAQQAGKVEGYEVETRRKDGSHFWTSITSLPREAATGELQFLTVSQDITNRKKAEEDLRTSEHQLRQAQALGRIGSWEFDIDAQAISWSDETYVLYERDPELGPPSPEEEARYYSIEQAKLLRDHASRAIETGETLSYALNVSLPSGKTACFDSVMQPVKDAQGRVFKLSGTVQDVTGQRLVENTLRNSEARYKGLAESISDVFFAMDSGLKYTYWNQASEKLTGVPAAEALGKHFFEIFSDNEATRSLANEYREAIRTGQSRHVTIAYPGGPQLIHDISAYPSEDGVSVFVKDVTERVRQQERLLFSDAAFKSIHEGVFAMDDDTVVTHWNGICEDLFGIKASEAIGRQFRGLVSMVEDYPGQNEQRIKLLRAQGYNKEEQLYRTPRGEVWLDIHSQAMESRGKRTGWVVLALDITERKRAEEERRCLEQKAQINSRLAAVGEMAAGIAHEINNPLTGVVGFSRLLLERGNLPEDIKEELGIIADGSQRVSDIVKRLLTFARQTKPVRTTADLNELIDNTLKLREYVLRTANIDVFMSLDPELPMLVVDPGQLQQVFMNLIVNAEQAMKEAHGKGTLFVTTEKKGHSIRICFQDDGPGITQENVKRLFQPFFTTKDVGQGTGLGLSLSRSIILEHGGELTFESEPGHGAVFIVELPITEAIAAEAGNTSPPAKADPATKGKGRILVVEDEPGIRELMGVMLTKAGHSVDTISNAGETMDRLAGGGDYDMIISDIRMPGMNGMELYERILERAPAMAHRVMFVTGDIMGADVAAFLDQRKLPYLAKPFTNAELKEQVGAILRAGQPGNEGLDRSSL